MPDLHMNMREALLEYASECREVSDGYIYHFTRRDKCVLLGCCLLWLWDKTDKYREIAWSKDEDPLRCMLEEVRAEMESLSDE